MRQESQDANSVVNCICICGDELTTRFMQHADVLERFKVIAFVKKIQMTLKPGVTAEQGLRDLRTVLERAGQRAVATFIPGSPIGAWRDETVRVISDGHNWQMLDDVLTAYGFEQRRVDQEASGG